MTATYTHSTLTGEPRYTVRKCNERSNPLMVAEALRIHANGYLSMGFSITKRSQMKVSSIPT